MCSCCYPRAPGSHSGEASELSTEWGPSDCHPRVTARFHQGHVQAGPWNWPFSGRAPRAGSACFPSLSAASVSFPAGGQNHCVQHCGGNSEGCHSGHVCRCCVGGCGGPHCPLVYSSLGGSSVPGQPCVDSVHTLSPPGAPPLPSSRAPLQGKVLAGKKRHF